jgi:hypothetical protein
MDRKPLFAAHFRYRFDRAISGGTGKLIAWLAAISGFSVVVASVLIVAGVRPVDGERMNFFDSLWITLGVALDPGVVEDSGWPYRAVMLGVAILGILIVSTIQLEAIKGVGEKQASLIRAHFL